MTIFKETSIVFDAKIYRFDKYEDISLAGIIAPSIDSGPQANRQHTWT